MVFVYLVVKMNPEECKAHEKIGFLIFPYYYVIRDRPQFFFFNRHTTMSFFMRYLCVGAEAFA